MADIADLAQTIIDMDLARATRRRHEEGPSPTGECLYCHEPLDPPRRWCDAKCRDKYEITTKHQKNR